MARAQPAAPLPPLEPDAVRDPRRSERRHPAWASSTSTDHTESTELSILTSTDHSSSSPLLGGDRTSADDGQRDAELAANDTAEEEDAPLIAASGSASSETAEPGELSRWAVASLLLQHLSSTFIDGAYNFACFLFLIEVFTDSLVPASLVGFGTKLAGLVLSGSVGGLVDRYPRLWFVRRAIAAQKCLQALSYGLFLSESGATATLRSRLARGTP